MYQLLINGKTYKELNENLVKAAKELLELDKPAEDKPVTTEILDTKDVEPVATEEAGTYSLEEDVIPAMQAYAKRHGRDSALKLLKKHGAKSTKDLSKERYETVMGEIL